MKIICTPLTSEAMSLLDTNSCPDHLLESISLTLEEYDQIQKAGVLEKINGALGKMIDDYEDETINTPNDLRKSLMILKANLTPENSEIINKVIHLTTVAINKNTGLYFFF